MEDAFLQVVSIEQVTKRARETQHALNA